MEYSIISMLDYFKDTLANMRPYKAWMEWDSNDATQIENIYVNHESNREKTEWNPVKTASRIKLETIS